jgi:thiamine biosynthesis lipoprotein ApbE
MDLFHRTFPSMHTRLSIHLSGVDDGLRENPATLVRNECNRIEMKLGRFAINSLVVEINRTAYSACADMDDEIAVILKLCAENNRRTLGAFDITFGNFTSLEGQF